MSRLLLPVVAVVVLGSGLASWAADSPSLSPSATPPGVFDFSYVSADCFGAFVVRPRRIAASPLLQGSALRGEVDRLLTSGGVRCRADEIEQFLMAITPAFDEGSPAGPFVPLLVTRFAPASDAKRIMADICGELEPRQAGTKTYYRAPSGIAGAVVYLPDEHTAVYTNEANLLRLFADEKPTSPLLERLRQLDPAGDVAGVIVLDPLREFLARELSGGPRPDWLPAAILGVSDQLQAASLTVHVEGDPPARLVLEGRDARTADLLADLARSLLHLTRLAFDRERDGLLTDRPPEVAQPLVDTAGELLKGLTVRTQGNSATVQLSRPAGLAELPQRLERWIACERRRESLRRVGFALRFQADTSQGRLPAAASYDKDGRPLLSWRVHALPGLDGLSLYESFHLDEPWDSPHNIQLLPSIPPEFRTAPDDNSGATRVMAFTGPGTFFAEKSGFPLDRTHDADAILVFEARADQAVPWTKPQDVPFFADYPASAPSAISDDGTWVVQFNSTVRWLTKGLDSRTLHRLIGVALDDYVWPRDEWPPPASAPADPRAVDTARTQLGVLKAAVLEFRANVGRLPTATEGLDALIQCPSDLSNPTGPTWGGPYLHGPMPHDPWGREFRYEPTDDDFAIYSAGPNGRCEAGGGDDIAVIGPDDVDVVQRRGMAAVAQQDWPLAIRSFTQVRKTAPYEPAELFRLALAHDKAGHELVAMAWFHAFLAVAPRAENAEKVRARISELEAAVAAKVPILLQVAENLLKSTDNPSGTLAPEVAGRLAATSCDEIAAGAGCYDAVPKANLEPMPTADPLDVARIQAARGDVDRARQTLERRRSNLAKNGGRVTGQALRLESLALAQAAAGDFVNARQTTALISEDDSRVRAERSVAAIEAESRGPYSATAEVDDWMACLATASAALPLSQLPAHLEALKGQEALAAAADCVLTAKSLADALLQQRQTEAPWRPRRPVPRD